MNKEIEFSPLYKKCVVPLMYLRQYRISDEIVKETCKKRCGKQSIRKTNIVDDYLRESISKNLKLHIEQIKREIEFIEKLE